MLDTLKRVHQELLAQIDALEAIVRQPVPQREALATARWRLMRASRARLKLLADNIYPALAAKMPQRIVAFQADDSAKRNASAAHIALWDTDRIVAEWRDYRKLSVGITAAMRRRVADEQAVFYPALKPAINSSAATPFGKSTPPRPGTALETLPSHPG
jgi:hypothetical protein